MRSVWLVLVPAGPGVQRRLTAMSSSSAPISGEIVPVVGSVDVIDILSFSKGGLGASRYAYAESGSASKLLRE
jgi:hypothetical protein